MATRVNTKFVVTLTVVLLVACAGVVGAFAFLLYNTASDLARMGDKQMALAKYKEAGDLYAKAVNKEPTNSEFLSKWIESLRKQTPQTQPRYMEGYRNFGNAMRQLAAVKRDEAAQRAYLEMEKQALEMTPVKRDALDGYIREADTFIAQHDPGKADALRRYRGLVRLRVAIEAQDATPDYMEGARQDLEAALAAAPDDSEAARGLERYYAVKARRAEIANNESEAKEAIAKGGEIVSAFLARHPDDAPMQLVVVRRDWDAAQREVIKAGAGLDLKQKSEEFRARTLPKLDAASAAALATPAEKIDRGLIGAMRTIEQLIDPPARQSRSEQLVRRALTARPQSAELIGTLADIQESREDHGAAVTTLQQVVDMPDLPLSLEGAMLFQLRSEALMRQGLWTFKQWQVLVAAPDKAVDAKAAADRVRSIRAKLGELEEADSPGLTLLDAEIAYIDQDDAKAARLLERFNRTTNNASADALMTGAMVALRRNEPGQAAQLLRELINLQRTNLRAALILATIDAMQLQNYEEAKRLYEDILRAVPDNAQAKEGLKIVTAVMQGSNAKVDDPIVEAVLRADAMTRDARSADGAAQAAAMLRQKIKDLGADPRLVRQLVFAEIRNNNKAGAQEAVKQGLAANPDNKDLQMLDIRLGSTDELEARLAIINMQGLPDAERLAERYLAFRQANKKVEAQAELDKAIQADPDSKVLLELVFMKSLEDKDFEKAKGLTDRAVKEDLDRCGGATYRARLESAMGRPAEAVRVMEEFVKGGGVQPESWRLLGRLQNQMGRHADAVKSFRAALALRPGDVPTIKDLLNTQVVMQAHEDALTTARQNRQWASGDDEFTNVWLSLEAQFGNRKMVIGQRERIARQDPEDRDNQMALAALYLDENQPEKARAIIDAIRAKKDDLDVVNLDAGWHWANRDSAKARGVFDAYIDKLDSKEKKLQALIVYAKFLGQRQDAPGALAAMEKAREFQTAGEADKVIGDTYQSIGRPEDAIPAFKRVIDAGADTSDHTYLKRMIESMINLRKFADAEAALAPLLKDNPDAVVLMLASDLKAGQGDERGQRQMLDRAVAQFPSEPMPFVKRAQSLMPKDGAEVYRLRDSKAEADKPRYLDIQRDLTDAVSDLDRALQLQPDMWVALRLRALAHELKGETEQHIADLRAALLANPSDQELLRGLIVYLVQSGRENDAINLSSELAQRRASDPMIRVNLAGVFGGLNKWDQAARFMAEAFEMDQQDGIAQRYLDSLLSCTPPKLAEAEDVFKKLGDRVQTNPGLLMAQAKLLMKQNQPGPAAQATAAALRLLNPDNPRDMIAWYNDVQKVEPNPAKQHAFLVSLKSGAVSSSPGVVLWLNYFDAALMVQDPSGQQQGTQTLRDVLKDAKTPPLRQMASRMLGMALYGQKQFTEAEQVMQTAFKEFPSDAENMNNLSYMLVMDLNRPADALPLAEKAAALSPNSSEVLDTLGVVQQRNNQVDKAVETLTRARQLAQSSFAAATITIHLADALWTAGKKEEARAVMKEAADLVTQQGAGASAQTKSELLDLQKKITGSEGTK
jgi:tetratricopeptide (TPR) repeat protein